MKVKIADVERELVPYFIESLGIAVYGEKVGKAGIIYSPPGWAELSDKDLRLPYSGLFYLSLWKYEDEFVALCATSDLLKVQDQVINHDWTAVIAVVPDQLEVILSAFDDVGFPIR